VTVSEPEFVRLKFTHWPRLDDSFYMNMKLKCVYFFINRTFMHLITHVFMQEIKCNITL
jgi:hypothetical protein